MKKYSLVILFLFSAGCTVVTRPSVRQMTNVADVTLGSSRQQVKGAVEGEVVIGYEKSDNASGTFVPIKLKNPVRVEYLESAGKKYEVDYYFSQIKQADGDITDDELTPLVFQNGVLISKSWDEFNKIKSNP